jgi:hypothetical protein
MKIYEYQLQVGMIFQKGWPLVGYLSHNRHPQGENTTNAGGLSIKRLYRVPHGSDPLRVLPIFQSDVLFLTNNIF